LYLVADDQCQENLVGKGVVFAYCSSELALLLLSSIVDVCSIACMHDGVKCMVKIGSWIRFLPLPEYDKDIYANRKSTLATYGMLQKKFFDVSFHLVWSEVP
jgi:hypothetical protein